MKRPGNILVLTYWAYSDALIQTYTLPYVRMMSNCKPADKIFLFTLEKDNRRQAAQEDNIIHVPYDYYPFGLRAGMTWLRYILRLRTFIRKNNIRTIHCWCTPAGMIGYILSKLTGAELIIDSYEPHAEAMVENGEWDKGGTAFKTLYRFERLQTRHASVLIATTEGMKEYARQRFGHTRENIFVKPACVDLRLFSEKNLKSEALIRELGLQEKIVCVYAGKFGGIYLDKEVFDFFRCAEIRWGDRFRALILSPEKPEMITAMAEKAGMQQNTIVLRFVPHARIADYMGLADFAITPVKPVPAKRYCSPIKDGEYWALGLPVVIPANISDDSGIIRQFKIGSILEDLNTEAYEHSLEEIDAFLCRYRPEERYKLIRPVAERFRNFNIAENIYKQIYS